MAKAQRMKHAFVSMPSGEDVSRLYATIKSNWATTELVFQSFLDEAVFDQRFEHDVCEMIAYSNLVVAILTSASPNVLYEVGLARAYGKPLVLLAKSMNDVPTMLAAFDIVLYDSNDPNYSGVIPKLRKKIENSLIGGLAKVAPRTVSHARILLGLSTDDKDGGVAKSVKLTRVGDTLSTALGAYHAGDFRAAIDVLLPGFEAETLDGNECYLLSDALFLHAESEPESNYKHSLHSMMKSVCEFGRKVDAGNVDLYKNLGIANLKIGNIDEAKRVFEELHHRNPFYEWAPYNIACICALREDLFGATTILEPLFSRNDKWRKLARLDPDFDLIWNSDLFQRILYPSPHRVV